MRDRRLTDCARWGLALAFGVMSVGGAGDDAGVSVAGPVHDVAKGVWRYTVRCAYLGGENAVEVLLPDALDRRREYRVLYVLPVEPGLGGQYGDGLQEVRRHDLHNRFSLVCVTPAFDTWPWYCDHDEKPALRHETYLLQVVLPLVEKNYPVQRGPAGRLLLGFSKSGWGAFTLILRHPDVFGRAASWDAPLMADQPRDWGMGPQFGSQANFEKYRVSALLETQAALFRDPPRLVLLGEYNFGASGMPAALAGKSHTAVAHERMLALGIRHVHNDSLRVEHAWGAGWVKPAVEALIGLDAPAP